MSKTNKQTKTKQDDSPLTLEDLRITSTISPPEETRTVVTRETVIKKDDPVRDT